MISLQHPNRSSKAAFETVIEAHLLAHGYTRLAAGSTKREQSSPDSDIIATNHYVVAITR